MRKPFALLGLALLISGIIALSYSTQERITEEKITWTWGGEEKPIWPSTLNPVPDPTNRTFAGTYMGEYSWFELDLTFSGNVIVGVFALEQQEQIMMPIFLETGTRFTQKVVTNLKGTYHIEIRNEGSISVDIEPSSAVVAKQNQTTKLILYPYTSPGVLLALGGGCVLLFGLFAKPRKAPKTRKHLTSK